MTISKKLVKEIILTLLNASDYRVHVNKELNTQFLNFSVDFFKKVLIAKCEDTRINEDWYRREFLSEELPMDDLIIQSGLNVKTVSNMRDGSKRKISKDKKIEICNNNYEELLSMINELTTGDDTVDIKLTISLNDASARLNISESLIVINTLAVKRAALRGGLWSSAGKRVEKPLMRTLCGLYQVPSSNCREKPKHKESKLGFDREVDFFLLKGKNEYRCEVKLMGHGNPESGDVIFARKPDIFVADSLSEQNRNQLNHEGIQWVQLRSDDGFRRFKKMLEHFKIPHGELLPGDVQENAKRLFKDIFRE